MHDLLIMAAERATHYLNGLNERSVAPAPEALARLAELGGSLPEMSTEPAVILALLDRIGSPATLASAGGRYFGFVVGGALPAALAANWLAGAWDQNAGMAAMAPAVAAIEDITQRWLLEVLGLPAEAGVGFVTGATMANFSALAAARHALLERAGWNVEAQGLFGAPPITVVVGDEVHVSVLKALNLLGFGRERVVRVPVDRQGRMRSDALPSLDGSTIICLQAGNVNSGACDPADAICAIAHDAGAWVHVDGAFGLWLAAAPERAQFVRGIAAADSWATDAHKWLNVPYDSGLVICRQPEHLRAAMSVNAAYLGQQDGRGEPFHYTHEMSRRARGVEVWAALRSLGRTGLVDLIERNCRHAARFASGLRAAGYQVLNDVISNQVLKELNTIYTTMQDRFDKIDVQLGRITTGLDEIQQTLNKLSLDLSRLQHDNFEFLDALGRRPLRDAINGAIGYKQRTGVDMPYQPDFVGYENTFQAWGTINAFDALSAGPTQRDYSDKQVLAELSAYPLDANLNYLNGWLQAHGMTPFASKRLASPRDWAFAGGAYANIGFDWPQHMHRIDPQRQAALDAVGNDLETAMHGISTIDTPNGPQGNAPLFDGVMAYYTAKLGAVDTALQSTQSAYVQEVQGRLQRSEPFDLFGGLDQPLAYQPADFASMTCGGAANGVTTPSNLKNIVPSYNRLTLADYMGVSKLTACLTAKYVDESQDCYTPPGEELPTCITYGYPQATLTVYVGTVALVSSSLTYGVGGAESDAAAMDLVMDAWATYFKPYFEAQFASAAAGTNELADITSVLQNQLRGYQQEFFGRVVNGLTNGSLHPAAVELAGAKKLLDSFVTLGFSQATNDDDFLRSLLFSDQQLPDDQQIIATYAASINAASSDTLLTTNPRLTVSDTAQKRRDALSGLLKRYLDGISAQTYSEDSALVADTRLDLRLSRSFADTGSPSSPDQPTPTPPTPTPSPTQPAQPTSPGKNKVIFLPAVVR